jgi:putative addiction module killer protein
MWVIVYTFSMQIRKTSEFDKWFNKLKDPRAAARILIRIKRLVDGNPGDSRFLGDISEMRIDYGPGYRVYYRDTGKEIIILLCGGDKTTQQVDIARARQIAVHIQEEK